MNDKTINITISLQQFVDSHLGRNSSGAVYPDGHYGGDKMMWSCRPIQTEIAEIIVLLTDNKHTCFIQWDDDYSNHLKQPLLWDYGEWLKHSDRHQRAQAYSQHQREERFILEANIKLLSKAITSAISLEGEHATLLAHKLLLRQQHGKIRLLAPDIKLITSIEEI